MGRVPLHRGWDSHSNEWKYGCYVNDIKDFDTDELEHMIMHNKGCTTIDVKSLGTYTGRDDQEGTKLFDGDIIEMLHFIEPDGTERYMRKVIVWSETYGAFMYRHYDSPVTETYSYLHALLKTNRVKQVGSTYEEYLMDNKK